MLIVLVLQCEIHDNPIIDYLFDVSKMENVG